MNRDLIISQLHQFFDAQFMAVCRKLLIFLRQPLGKLLLPDLQECAHLANIVILAIILGADLPYRAARLCLYGIIGGVRFGCLSQKQQITLPALHTLPVDITVGNAVAELPAVHENIFQLIWNLNLELFACKRKLFPDRLQILFYMRIFLEDFSGTKGQLLFLSAGGQFVMPLQKFAYTIHDGVVCVITEAERHGKVVPPQFNDTFAAQIQFLHLPVQVMLDLPIAHPICNELQLLRVNMFLAHPLDRKI